MRRRPRALRTLTRGARGLGVLVCSGLFGCALQIAGAYQAPLREQHPARSVSLELALRYKPAKGSGGYAAFDSSFSDPTPRAPFSLREAAVGGGYHVMFPRFALEVGPRLGLGRPATSDFPGTSLHTAVDVALLYRAWNDADRRLGFQSFAPSLDVVLFARGGVWSRPISHPGDEVLDAALGLGVRVNLASGITDLRDRDWELP